MAVHLTFEKKKLFLYTKANEENVLINKNVSSAYCTSEFCQKTEAKKKAKKKRGALTISNCWTSDF